VQEETVLQESTNRNSHFPKSIMNAQRNELPGIEMQIKEGNLPNDLQGHIFIVAPVGTINSNGLPFKDGNTFLNGDGMIYRLDFNQTGKVTLKTRLTTPPDYWVDKAIEENEFLRNNYLLRFQNHGLMRFSYLLGSRNELNTAFLSMPFPGKSPGELNERLLVTYDAGRPYEIDTETLELVTPVGSIKEWQAEVIKPQYPFSPILSTAHPAFDTYQHQMFTVNYGRSLSNILGDKVEIYKNRLKAFITDIHQTIIDEINEQVIDSFEIEKQSNWLKQIWQLILILLNRLQVIPDDFVYLIRWDGENSWERWKLVNSDGSPLVIKQTMHQIGLTEDYIVLMDTSFIAGISQLLNNPLPQLDNEFVQQFMRDLRDILKNQNKPLPDSVLYIVRRDDLKKGQNPAKGEAEVEVKVQKVVIPCEASHFLVDYKNPDHKITLHLSHTCAWHLSEWLRSYDKYPYDSDNNPPIPPNLLGTHQSEMDISRMGRYVIEVGNFEENKPARIVSTNVISDDSYTWGPGLFAYLDRLPSSGMTPNQLDNIYWVSFGLWKDLTSDFIYQLYKDYKYRLIKPPEQVLKLAEEGRQACLYRLHTSSMAIADYYMFPESYLGLSPQFVPRASGKESSTNGYIVCTVFTPDQERDEIWIFDASDLKKGPLCQLHADKLNFGFSLHTAWLKNINRRQTSYNISAKEDCQESVANLLTFVDTLLIPSPAEKQELKEKINELFEQNIYLNFEESHF
jgi:carotenoid cleavage dioxygenase-like enzyme